MIPTPPTFFGIPRDYQPLLRDLGLTDIHSIFTDPRILPWRSIPERENCTLDATLPDGRTIRLHVKRFHPTRESPLPGEQEANGINALKLANIPTAPLVAWGKFADGRTFVITENLAGYEPADKLLAAGAPFDRLLAPTADLAARLHSANLHHRDLYLCHFFVNPQTLDIRLIDAARVRRLPMWPFKNRWIVKDLAQFWYSALQLDIPEPQRLAWLTRYAQSAGLPSPATYRRGVERKAARIARHDESLRRKQPNRNVSIPRP